MFKTSKLTDKKKRLFFSQLQVLLKAGLSFTSSFSLIIEGATGNEATGLSPAQAFGKRCRERETSPGWITALSASARNRAD